MTLRPCFRMAEEAWLVFVPLAPSTQPTARKCLIITAGQVCGLCTLSLARRPLVVSECYAPDAYLTGVHTVGCPRGRTKARGLAQYGVPHCSPLARCFSAPRLNSAKASLQSAARKPTCVLVVQARSLVQWDGALAAFKDGDNVIVRVVAPAAEET